MAEFRVLEDGSPRYLEDGTTQRVLEEREPTIAVLFPVAAPTLASVMAARTQDPVVRIRFVSGDLSSTTHEVAQRLISGSVTMDRNRTVPRQASIALINTDSTYTPVDPASLVWPGRLVQVEYGFLVNGSPEYVTLMTGLLSKPAMQYGSSSVTFSLWSRLRLLDRQFPEPLAFDAGTSVSTVVRTVCELGGLGTNDALYDLDHGGAALQVPRSFDINDHMLNAIVEFCRDHGLDGPYDSGAGVVMLRPFVDPSESDVSWTFAPGQFSLLTDLAWSIEERGPIVYNRQDVWGVAPDRYPVHGQWRDLNPASPTYNPVDGSGPLGDLPAPPHVSADIHTEFQANNVAQLLGTERALADLPVRASVVPVPTLAPRDVVRFATDDLNITARLDSLTIPLGPGEMSLAAQGVRSLIAPASASLTAEAA